MDDPACDLCRGLCEGRHEAWAALYDRSAARLFRVAWGLLGHREEAEDAVQEVFARMARARASLATVHNLNAYLFAALRRVCAETCERRARARLAATAAQEVSRVATGQGDSEVDFQEALRGLPDEQREVVLLKIDGALTFGEIAQALGISPNTAASRYRYALEKLRATLEARCHG